MSKHTRHLLQNSAFSTGQRDANVNITVVPTHLNENVAMINWDVHWNNVSFEVDYYTSHIDLLSINTMSYRLILTYTLVCRCLLYGGCFCISTDLTDSCKILFTRCCHIWKKVSIHKPSISPIFPKCLLAIFCFAVKISIVFTLYCLCSGESKDDWFLQTERTGGA